MRSRRVPAHGRGSACGQATWRAGTALLAVHCTKFLQRPQRPQRVGLMSLPACPPDCLVSCTASTCVTTCLLLLTASHKLLARSHSCCLLSRLRLTAMSAGVGRHSVLLSCSPGEGDFHRRPVTARRCRLLCCMCRTVLPSCLAAELLRAARQLRVLCFWSLPGS